MFRFTKALALFLFGLTMFKSVGLVLFGSTCLVQQSSDSQKCWLCSTMLGSTKVLGLFNNVQIHKSVSFVFVWFNNVQKCWPCFVCFNLFGSTIFGFTKVF